ncbi:MAG: hypothetical protein AAF433_02565 [Bacteroidota bacterium]
MKHTSVYQLKDFLDRFLEIELPVTISQDTINDISKVSKPLPPEMVGEYLIPFEEGQVNDEYTEFVACFQLPVQQNFRALVYWRADLLQYHYVLVTLEKKTGKLIDRRVIAGTTYVEGELTQSSAAIREELTIYVVSGQGSVEEYDYKASGSTASRLQISKEGKIMEL